jgi:hypothetical protein
MKTPMMALIIAAIIVLAIWDGVWKLIAMWKSARNGQLPWFICLAVFNTVGILPILYILLFQKMPPPEPPRV